MADVHVALPKHVALPYRVAGQAGRESVPMSRAQPAHPHQFPFPRKTAKNIKSLVISAIKTRVMMNFNLLIVRDPVIFSKLAGSGDLRLAVIYLGAHYSLHSTVLFISNPRVGFQFLPAIELSFDTLL